LSLAGIFATITRLMQPQALVIERDRLVARRVQRVLAAAGFAVRGEEEQPERGSLEDVSLVCADGSQAERVARWLGERARLAALLWTESADEPLLGLCRRSPRLAALLARPAPDQPPRDDELIGAARAASTGERPPFASHLAWGATGFQLRVSDGAGREAAVARVADQAARIGAPKRQSDSLAELTHELLMNAMYDAPVDGRGRARFAHDRKAPVRLDGADAAQLRCASDGSRFAVEVEDRFGRLTREHVFGGIARGLRGGEQDRSHGGAGLGMLVLWRAATALHFDVAPGARTRVTALTDLDLNQRALRQAARTIHFPEPVNP
jgi:hypothetical protein